LAVLTTLQRLENVQTAIAEVETSGQSFAFGSRSMGRGDLKILYEQERRLIAQYSFETKGRTQNFVRFDDQN
jgi:hypothetical protein